MSGSISFGYLRSLGVVGTAFGRIPRPIQRALPPDIKESGQHQNDENQHLEKPKDLELAIHHGPRVEKNGFDVEKDKDDGNQIKLDAEAFTRRAGGRDAGFVGRILYAVPNPFAQ